MQRVLGRARMNTFARHADTDVQLPSCQFPLNLTTTQLVLLFYALESGRELAPKDGLSLYSTQHFAVNL